MSATVHDSLISSYFSSCPIIRVPGRIFPVEQFYLEEIHQIIRNGQLIQSGLNSSINYPTSNLTKKTKKKKNTNNINLNENYLIPHIDEEKIAEFIIRLIQKENIEINKKIEELNSRKFTNLIP